MTNRTRKKLVEVSTKIGSGATPRGGEASYKVTGTPLIRSLNVYDLKFNFDNLAFIDSEQAKKLSNVLVEKDDVLLNITGASVCRCTSVPDQLVPARVNQHVSIIRADKINLDSKYLKYALISPKYKKALWGLATTGATREALTKENIENFELDLPEISIQKQVSATISTYDDLIESNEKRIKILEAMAQLLYTEWFVKFKFPGHEQVRMVDSGSEYGMIPEDWEVKRLDVVAQINPENIKRLQGEKLIHYIDISSVSTGMIDSINTMPFSQAPSRARRVVRHGDIIWATVRPNRRSYSLIVHPIDNILVSTGFVVVRATEVPFTYAYQVLTTDAYVGYLVNHARGAAYPAVTGVDFEKSFLLIPNQNLLDKFHKIVCSLHEQIDLLYKESKNLSKIRDLLIPQLVTGRRELK